MREVLAAHDSTLTGFYESMLAGAGIPCFVRGYHDGYAGIDGIVIPTLCILNDADYPRAVQMLRQARGTETTAPPDWVCCGCGEEVPGSFDLCWKCGRERSA